ncbi:MAG: hypothetical protein ACK46G_05835 [Flavobacteriales bacterium]|jgi:hypothetical protein
MSLRTGLTGLQRQACTMLQFASNKLWTLTGTTSPKAWSNGGRGHQSQ